MAKGMDMKTAIYASNKDGTPGKKLLDLPDGWYHIMQVNTGEEPPQVFTQPIYTGTWLTWEGGYTGNPYASPPKYIIKPLKGKS